MTKKKIAVRKPRSGEESVNAGMLARLNILVYATIPKASIVRFWKIMLFYQVGYVSFGGGQVVQYNRFGWLWSPWIGRDR